MKEFTNPLILCFTFFFVSDIAESLLKNLQSPDLKTGNSFLQEKLSQVLPSNSSSTRVSQIWSTMHLKLDFPRSKDSYVPHEFENSDKTYNFDKAVDTVANCTRRVVLITAPPGMGKSRASEEIHTQLVLRGHFVIYVKISQIIPFWTKCDDKPSVRDFLKECIGEDKLQQCPEEKKMIVVMDGFDEVCPHFRSKVLALIKELLVKGNKVLITSRPQEKDQIIKGLELEEQEIVKFEIKLFSFGQKVLMLQTRLNLEETRLANILFKILMCDLLTAMIENNILSAVWTTFEMLSTIRILVASIKKSLKKMASFSDLEFLEDSTQSE
jgi:NACHT domain